MINIDRCIGIINNFVKRFQRNDSAKVTKPLPVEIRLAILSNGGGYTVPQAIKTIEKETKTKIKHINYESPFDNLALSKEVEMIIAHIVKHNLQDKYLSRADAFISLVKEDKVQFVNDKNEPVKKLSLAVINRISEEAKELDGIFLPGGIDIPSIWYGSDSVCKDIYRSLVEFTLISEARKRGIPLMGVCRGLQIVSVFNGAILEERIPNQFGNQRYKLLEDGKKGLLTKLFQEGLVGLVLHHQGVHAEGMRGDLEPLAVYDVVVKAAESKYSASSPVILTQFHPEFYGTEPQGQFDPEDPNARITAGNGEFYKIFRQGAIARGVKRLYITPEILADAYKKLNPVGYIGSFRWKLNRKAVMLSRRIDAWCQVHIFGKKAK
ncbi:MAG TPA: gamma-glutamyl-gamma-aminobutyrate hydrolase family protein [Parachlamydiaceae bacterium]|nr:gamma-glutamyl-gamma-aminobutyrate hydrolase family protein [Parachlamydiaceae bacterium]